MPKNNKTPQEKLKEIRESSLGGLKSKWEKATKLADLNEYGFGEVSIDTLRKHGLSFGNGCDIFRDSSTAHSFFNIQIVKDTGVRGNPVAKIKFLGLSSKNNNIGGAPINIVKEMKNRNIKCVLTNKRHSRMEIDHKIGAKKFQADDDPRLKDIGCYQWLSGNNNVAKREACKFCQENKKRPVAPDGYDLPFYSGSSILVVNDYKPFTDPHNPCYGCFYYDIEMFRREHTKLCCEYNVKYIDLRSVREVVLKMNIDISDVFCVLKAIDYEGLFQKKHMRKNKQNMKDNCKAST